MADNIEANQSTKTRRPITSSFLQQKLPSWDPLLTAPIVILLLFVIGICFIPTGSTIITATDDQYEKVISYDGPSRQVECTITTSNQGRSCQVSFTLDQKVTGPLYLFYQLSDFYQNHRTYAASVDRHQLSAETSACDWLTSVDDPKVKNGTLNLNPCGLVAASYFNAQSKAGVSFDETGISWKSDRDYKYKQVLGFTSKLNPSSSNCDTLLGKSTGSKAYTDSKTSLAYCFWYPNDDSILYLYEMFPQISPLLGVTDEHFIVWMRTAATPLFRKLYGKIDSNFNKGDVITFNINANYFVGDIGVTKSLILTNLGEFGNKNAQVGVVYVVVGAICMVLSAFFLLKHTIHPRELGTELIQGLGKGGIAKESTEPYFRRVKQKFLATAL